MSKPLREKKTSIVCRWTQVRDMRYSHDLSPTSLHLFELHGDQMCYSDDEWWDKMNDNIPELVFSKARTWLKMHFHYLILTGHNPDILQFKFELPKLHLVESSACFGLYFIQTALKKVSSVAKVCCRLQVLNFLQSSCKCYLCRCALDIVSLAHAHIQI